MSMLKLAEQFSRPKAKEINSHSIDKLEHHVHSWGYEAWLHNDGKYCMKVLVFENEIPGSKHYHTEKEETMLCVKGEFVVWRSFDGEHHLKPGCFVTLTAGTPHQIKCTKQPGWLVEASTFHSDKDVTRL